MTRTDRRTAQRRRDVHVAWMRAHRQIRHPYLRLALIAGQLLAVTLFPVLGGLSDRQWLMYLPFLTLVLGYVVSAYIQMYRLRKSGGASMPRPAAAAEAATWPIGKDGTLDLLPGESWQHFVQREHEVVDARARRRDHEEVRAVRVLAPLAGGVAAVFGLCSATVMADRLAMAAIYAFGGFAFIWLTAVLDHLLRPHALTQDGRDLFFSVYLKKRRDSQ